MEIKQEVEGFRKEFEIFCAQFHENLIKCGKVATVMTLKQEEELTKYLLTPQDETGSSSTEIASWLENNVFCLVSNEDESHYELHIWNDTQRKVVSIENYFTVLNSMFAETGNISHDKFLKKVNEKYALIPEEVVKYFINNVTKKPKFKVTVQNKENKVYGCKVISYEYLKKRVVKKRILTEIFDKSNGKVLQSRCHEEDPLEEDVFYVEKTEKLSDITNTKFTEVSSTTYSSNQALEIKYLGKTSVAYLPPGEINNQDHLVALSNVIYSVNDFPENTGDIQLEFVIPQKQPTKVFSEIESLLSLIEKTDSGSKPTEPKTLVKTPKKNTDTKTRPNMVITPPGKLAIVANPKTRGATLKHLFNEPLISESKIPSYSELNAAAATDIVETAMEEDDDNDDDDDDDDNGHDFLENVDDLFEDSAAPEVPAQVGHTREVEVIEELPLISEGTSIRIRNIVVENSDQEMNPSAEIVQEGKSTPQRTSVQTVKTRPINNNFTFTCDICGNSFRSRQTLFAHLKRHENTEYRCKLCDKTYRENSRLQAHMNTHMGVKPYKCSTCEESFTSAQLRSAHNFQRHIPPRYSCDVCGKRYRRRNQYVAHCSIHTGETPFKCNVCQKAFSSNVFLLRHEKVHLDLPKKPEPPGAHACQVCGMVLKYESALRTHLKRHKNVEYACDQCDKTYKDHQTLQEHLNIHNGVYPYQCSKCGESFASAHLRSNHNMQRHVPPRFTCDVCNKRYKDKRGLEVHCRTHTGEKPYMCETCSKTFRSNESLIQHRRIHSDVPHHTCPVCNKGFAQIYSMKIHSKTHQKPKKVTKSSKSQKKVHGE
ncbi:zinc finger protein 436 isoform X5 [Patella vulgata]|uniref:zinc finger protein 436 isoform X5 n=1 Tax=Patella vulgata TaxID=6465 RepID=UPI00217F34DE|nr:zinc finger protein 436 isoform X5 [Patella vulgata]